MRNTNIKSIFFTLLLGIILAFSNSFTLEDKFNMSNKKLNSDFYPLLSSYKLYEGKLANLKPSRGAELYELTSHLFVDYAEKQRLIRLPEGTKMKNNGDGLPDFPDGTILVKTFYWYKDKKKPALGRNIIETRLLIKIESQWKVATYKWNKLQTEANLITDGADVNVSWNNSAGKKATTLFHIPSNSECSECHQSDLGDIPIGPKLRNMNFDVTRNKIKINQLRHFQNLGLTDSVNLSTISALPNWENNKISLDKRARAYLDMNCAHCHNPYSSATNKKVFFNYEMPFDSTRIFLKKAKILKRMQSEDIDLKMPSIGTSIKDIEGLELIRKYINSLE